MQNQYSLRTNTDSSTSVLYTNNRKIQKHVLTFDDYDRAAEYCDLKNDDNHVIAMLIAETSVTYR